jgi:hypothetical protein
VHIFSNAKMVLFFFDIYCSSERYHIIVCLNSTIFSLCSTNFSQIFVKTIKTILQEFDFWQKEYFFGFESGIFLLIWFQLLQKIQEFSKISFVTTLVLHYDKQNKEIIIYNSNKHFHSSFTHTLLPFCFSKIFNCSWHFVLRSLSSVFSYNTVAWIGTRIWYTLTILTEQSSPVNLNTCMTNSIQFNSLLTNVIQHIGIHIFNIYNLLIINKTKHIQTTYLYNLW